MSNLLYQSPKLFLDGFDIDYLYRTWYWAPRYFVCGYEIERLFGRRPEKIMFRFWREGEQGPLVKFITLRGYGVAVEVKGRQYWEFYSKLQKVLEKLEWSVSHFYMEMVDLK